MKRIIFSLLLFFSLSANVFSQSDTCLVTLDYVPSTCFNGAPSQAIIYLYAEDGSTLLDQMLVNYPLAGAPASLNGLILWDGVLNAGNFTDMNIVVDPGKYIVATQIIENCNGGQFPGMISSTGVNVFDSGGSNGEVIEYVTSVGGDTTYLYDDSGTLISWTECHFDTTVIDPYNTIYVEICSDSQGNITNQNDTILVCKTPPPPISKSTSDGPNELGIAEITNINTKSFPQGPVPCGECARLNIYVETTTAKILYETIEGNTGNPASSANSTLIAGTESLLDHIVPSDILFDCQGASSFNFDSEEFVKTLAEQLQLSEAVTIRFEFFSGGTMCSNPPTNPQCLQESSNPDNWSEICQGVVVKISSVEPDRNTFVDTITSINIPIGGHQVGDSTFNNWTATMTNGLKVLFEYPECLFFRSISTPEITPQVDNFNFVNTETDCHIYDGDRTISITTSTKLDCFAIKITDYDSEALNNFDPPATCIEPIQKSVIGVDLIPTYDALGNITSIEPVDKTFAGNNTFWLYFENTQSVDITFDRLQGFLAFNEIKLCGCEASCPQ